MPKPSGLPGLTFEKVHDAFAEAREALRDLDPASLRQQIERSGPPPMGRVTPQPEEETP